MIWQVCMALWAKIFALNSTRLKRRGCSTPFFCLLHLRNVICRLVLLENILQVKYIEGAKARAA